MPLKTLRQEITEYRNDLQAWVDEWGDKVDPHTRTAEITTIYVLTSILERTTE